MSNRPPLFSWDTPKIKGNPIIVTASEWNKLTKNINQILLYKGALQAKFTVAEQGMPITAAIFNEVRGCVFPLGMFKPIPTATKGVTKITADHFNKLVEVLNSVT